MRAHSISLEDLSAAFANGEQRDEESAPQPRKRPPIPPKYRHPNTGETWTGRGRAPRWLTAQERAGMDRDDFLILKDRQ